MKILDRRRFLSFVPGPLLGVAFAPLLQTQSSDKNRKSIQEYPVSAPNNSGCWLDVCAPFFVEDSERDIHSEIILTSDTFVGRRGYSDGADRTEYELYLYDAAGRPIGPNGLASRLTVPAMGATVISGRSLVSGHKSFWGGMRIRLRPQGRETMHASDLFSSAFVRWLTPDSFDNVHANPDPLEWQKAESFYYSMPFPPLADYECSFSLFNPYDSRSAGSLTLYGHEGNMLIEVPYDLQPHASLLFSINAGETRTDLRQAFGLLDSDRPTSSTKSQGSMAEPLTRGGGMLAVTNSQGTQKAFGYLLIRRANRRRFSVEHPIHQTALKTKPATRPFNVKGDFAAKNVLFTPLLFRGKRVGEITFDSRLHLSTGLPLEEAMWFNLFATDANGNVPWLSAKDPNLPPMLLASQIDQGVIKLRAGQSCVLDFARLSVPADFSGGLSLAIAPDSTHTLMKVEVQIPEWGAHAFTHFRPGLRAARGYQKPKQRGGLATDYIISGAHVERLHGRVLFDELIGIINIDDQGVAGRPLLELFNVRGLVARIQLGPVPSFSTRHYLLSDLIREPIGSAPVSVRLVDEQATLLMSAVHLDYVRRDIALDHGSDRFSTFVDYDCSSAL